MKQTLTPEEVFAILKSYSSKYEGSILVFDCSDASTLYQDDDLPVPVFAGAYRDVSKFIEKEVGRRNECDARDFALIHIPRTEHFLNESF